MPVQSSAGAGSTPRLICRVSSAWSCASLSLQFLPPGAHTSGVMTKLPPNVPGRMAWLVPGVRPTESYSWSIVQNEFCITSA